MTTVLARAPFHDSNRSSQPQGTHVTSYSNSRVATLPGSLVGIRLPHSIPCRQIKCNSRCSFTITGIPLRWISYANHSKFCFPAGIEDRIVESSGIPGIPAIDTGDPWSPSWLHNLSGSHHKKGEDLATHRASYHSNHPRRISLHTNRRSYGSCKDLGSC